MRISRIRLFGSRIRYVTAGRRRGEGSGYRSSSRSIFATDIQARCERRLSWSRERTAGLRIWFSGRAASMVEIGKREKIGKRHVSEIIRLAFLAPDIVEQIVNGVQPPELTARTLLQKATRLPLDWESQHRFLGFPYPA